MTAQQRHRAKVQGFRYAARKGLSTAEFLRRKWRLKSQSPFDKPSRTVKWWARYLRREPQRVAWRQRRARLALAVGMLPMWGIFRQMARSM